MNSSRGTILIVDDERGIRESLRMILKDKYEVITFGSPEEVLKDSLPKVDVIFSDIKMLNMNGIDFLKEIKSLKPEVEVIMITAYPSFSTTLEALRCGAFDYIVKPFDKDNILQVAERSLQKRIKLIENRRMMRDLTLSLQENYQATVDTLISAIDAKDTYTARHSRRVSYLFGKIIREINFDRSRINLLTHIAGLHDIGKIGISGYILRKPSSLTTEEYEQIKQHPLIGYEILKPMKFLKEGLDIVLYHHEKFNGKGYPAGLKEEKIPYEVRIFSIVDVYDALVTERCYRKKISPQKAFQELKHCAGEDFDPHLIPIVIPILSKIDKESEREG